jgi:hypothetical protein
MRLGEHARGIKRDQARQRKKVPTLQRNLDELVPVHIDAKTIIMVSPDRVDAVKQKYFKS